MRTNEETNRLVEFTDSLKKRISDYVFDRINEKDFYNIDNALNAILLNNGCAMTAHPVQCIDRLSCNIDIIYIIGGKSNEATDGYFELVEFFGVTSFIIFLDYFKDMMTEDIQIPDNIGDKPLSEVLSIEDLAKYNNGNFSYFEAINNLAHMFIMYTSNQAIYNERFLHTSASRLSRMAPDIIAGIVVNSIKPLTENDIEGIPLEDLQKYISMPPGLVLSGIYNL